MADTGCINKLLCLLARTARSVQVIKQQPALLRGSDAPRLACKSPSARGRANRRSGSPVSCSSHSPSKEGMHDTMNLETHVVALCTSGANAAAAATTAASPPKKLSSEATVTTVGQPSVWTASTLPAEQPLASHTALASSCCANSTAGIAPLLTPIKTLVLQDCRTGAHDECSGIKKHICSKAG